jgi:hypothetical protein
MLNIFISYNRHSEATVRTLVDDIEALGHTVWFDQELRGGQTWWDQILAKIRDCDVFAFVLEPKALNSTACKREYGYAADLRKPILPVLVAEGMSMNLLPPALSQIQFVDYRKQDRTAVLRLARALTTVPPSKPLPDPTPEVPISYLGRLAEQIDTSSPVDYEKQSALVVDLKRSLRDSEVAEDALALLERLRKRRDLFATIAEEIDEFLRSIGKASAVPTSASKPELPPKGASSETPHSQQLQGKTVPPEPERKAVQQDEKPCTGTEKKPLGVQSPQHPATQLTPINVSHTTTPRARMMAALTGALLGTPVGVAAVSTYPAEPLTWGLLTGAGGAIAGSISGTHRQGIIGILLGAASGWFLVTTFWLIVLHNSAAFAAGGAFGAPAGAILGAIAERFLEKRKGVDLAQQLTTRSGGRV